MNRRGLLLALLLLPAAARAGEEAGPPAAPAKAPAPTLESVRRAYREGKHEAAADGATRLLAPGGGLDPAAVLEVRLIEAESLAWARRYPEAVASADRCLAAIDTRWTSAGQWTGRATLARAFSLLALGRTGEARAALDGLAARYPAEAEIEDALLLRSLLLAREGVLLVEDYRGSLRADPRIAAGYLRLRATFPAAVARVRERLGAPGLALPPIVVRARDELGLKGHYWMTARTFPRGGGSVGVVTVRAPLLAAPEEGEAEAGILSHEFLHVLRLAGPGKPPVPKWIEEGLAEWVESSDPRGVWRDLVGRVVCTPWSASVAKFGEAMRPKPEWGRRPLEGQRNLGRFLFAWLERTRGTEAVRKFALALVRTTEDPEAAFRAAFGLGFPEAHGELSAGFRGWALESLEGLEEMEALDAVLGKGGPDALAAATAEFVRKHPGSLLRPGVRMRLLWVLIGAGRHDEALALVEDVRRTERFPRGWRFLADFAEFQIASARGEGERAAALFRRMLDADPAMEEGMREGLEVVRKAVEEAAKRRKAGE